MIYTRTQIRASTFKTPLSPRQRRGGYTRRTFRKKGEEMRNLATISLGIKMLAFDQDLYFILFLHLFNTLFVLTSSS